MNSIGYYTEHNITIFHQVTSKYFGGLKTFKLKPLYIF